MENKLGNHYEKLCSYHQFIARTYAIISYLHSVKSVRVRSYSGLHFPAFGLNTERYSVSLRIHSECGKMWIKITPNTDTFYAVLSTEQFWV